MPWEAVKVICLIINFLIQNTTPRFPQIPLTDCYKCGIVWLLIVAEI
jgi:hypothetical protein